MTGQSMTYNDLDLIGNIVRNDTTLVNYSYLSDGTKLSALDGSGAGLVYRGPFVYRKSFGGNAGSSLTLESAAFGGGLMTPSGAMFYVTDYLGSIRAVVDGKTGDLYKASDYSAFGDKSVVMVRPQGNTPPHPLATAVLPAGLTLRDGYTGKEAQNEDFGTSYTDFGARQYNPALRRWMTPDPLSEKYYGTSPYAFCNNNPVNFVDPDGQTPRLYIQKSGIGHAFVTVGEGRNTIVYTYGRYGALNESSGSDSGVLTPKGEGVLLRLTGDSAEDYLSSVQKEGYFDIFQINEADDSTVSSFYDEKFSAGSSPTEPTKSSFNNPNARVINTYSLFNNNCVTTSLEGINSSSKVIDTDIIAPRSLARFMRKYSKENSDVIKIDNPQEFIKDLLNTFKNEKKD